MNDLNYLKTKSEDLEVDRSRTVSVDLKILNNVVSKEVAKNTKFN